MDVAEFGRYWTERWARWKRGSMPSPVEIERIGKELLAASTTGAWTRVVFANGIFLEKQALVSDEESLLEMSDRFGAVFQSPYFLKWRVSPGMRDGFGANFGELGFQAWCSDPADVAVLRLTWFDRITTTREFEGCKFEEMVRDMFNNPWALPVRP